MEQYIRSVFGDLLDSMRDQDMADRTVRAWVLAAARGGWQPEDLERIPFTLLTETRGINLIEHTLAVTRGALGLAAALQESYAEMPFPIHRDTLVAGGLLHDVGKLLEIEYAEGGYRKSHHGKCLRHPISGAIIAAEVGFGPDLVNTIANHAKEGEGRPQRVETVLIHQADFATFNPMTMLAAETLLTD